MTRICIIAAFVFTVLSVQQKPAFAWHDLTHLAISQAAGYKKWYNSAAADMAKDKVQQVEQFNHWYNNIAGAEITPEIVMSQVNRYNDSKDSEGHLYGAILASLQEYEASRASRKYADYNIAFTAHYIGDLSQPLHNIPYNNFNKTHHLNNDGIAENELASKKSLNNIKRNMYKIKLGTKSFEKDLSIEIARIANITRQLGYQLDQENRNMTNEEAYIQLGHSASLLKAVLAHVYKDSKP